MTTHKSAYDVSIWLLQHYLNSVWLWCRSQEHSICPTGMKHKFNTTRITVASSGVSPCSASDDVDPLFMLWILLVGERVLSAFEVEDVLPAEDPASFFCRLRCSKSSFAEPLASENFSWNYTNEEIDTTDVLKICMTRKQCLVNKQLIFSFLDNLSLKVSHTSS